MCVIVHQPKKAYLDKERAARLWKINDHGGGYAFINPNNGQINVRKSMEFDRFWRDFESDRSQFRDTDFMIHMRIATHGTINIDNVHPFRVDNHTWMAHNGIIHGVDEKKGEDLSDTRIFIRDVLPALPEDWLDNRYLFEMVEEWIGWSKLMFLTTNPKLSKNVYILNEKKGEVADGMWFSNGHGVRKPFKTAATTKGNSFRPYDIETSEGWERLRPPASLPTTNSKPKKKARVVGPDAEFRALTQYRKNKLSIYSPLSYRGKAKGWECLGCDEPVKVVGEGMGECDCWDTACFGCKDFAAVCDCIGGYSGNTAHWTQLSDRELQDIFRLNDKELEEVNRTMGRTTNSVVTDPFKDPVRELADPFSMDDYHWLWD